MAVADTSLAEVAGDVPPITRVSLRTRKTLRGHLAKIYAMHWASDSRLVVVCSYNILNFDCDRKAIVSACAAGVKL